MRTWVGDREKHGVKLPSRVQGWHLLAKASLTRKKSQQNEVSVVGEVSVDGEARGLTVVVMKSASPARKGSATKVTWTLVGTKRKPKTNEVRGSKIKAAAHQTNAHSLQIPPLTSGGEGASIQRGTFHETY